MRNKKRKLHINDGTCKNCILCCIPIIFLTEFFYKMCSCFSTVSTKINIEKTK